MGDINIKLKESADKLAAKINDIKAIATPSELHSYSDLIMGLIRAEHLFITDETIAKYENGDDDYKKATLQPKDLSCSPLENGKSIFANSFGPWNSKEYFNIKGDWTAPRILWILKESFIEDTWFTIQDRGGHNQASEFPSWEDLENTTLKKVVKLSKIILETIYDKVFEFNDVLNHLCILELNHFPGLAFNSRQSDRTNLIEWAEINYDLLKSLISFYSPNIIIGGRTLQLIHKCPPSCCESWDEDLIKNIKNEGTLLNNLGYTVDSRYATDLYINGKDNYILSTINNGPIFIQADHPSVRYIYSMAISDANRIKQIIQPYT